MKRARGAPAAQTDQGLSPVNSLPCSGRWGARWLWQPGAFRVTPAPSARPPWAGKPPASALAPSPPMPNQYALISCPFAEVTETGLINYFCRRSLKCASGTTSERVTFFYFPRLSFSFFSPFPEFCLSWREVRRVPADGHPAAPTKSSGEPGHGVDDVGQGGSGLRGRETLQGCQCAVSMATAQVDGRSHTFASLDRFLQLLGNTGMERLLRQGRRTVSCDGGASITFSRGKGNHQSN